MDITQFLQAAHDGDTDARVNLIQAAYDELRKIASVKMANERQDHTLTATALVNEVSLKLLHDAELPCQSRAQFLGCAAHAMRNVLIDHARTKGRQKRGGDRSHVEFQEAVIACQEQSDDLLALNEALEELANLEPRQAQVVEMRYFGGMTNQEIADALGISLATVKRDWLVAKSWLLCELRESPEDINEDAR